ncbi:MAG TPA: Spy/CpxP family protein refolding chaperone [Polyangiaceae bacterium]|jgi:Spy/CpxP family protein refolding chaperone
MHPGFAYWWRARGRHGACGDEGSCGAEAHAEGHHGHHGRHRHGPDFGGPPPWADVAARFGGFEDGDFGSFGVRRPLRFLAHKLDLDDTQVASLAAILDELKTERAQGAVDQRRTTASFADAIGGETFDEAKVGEAADVRVKSAERLRGAVVKALGRIHGILNPEQRAKLAYLLRTGALAI